MSEDLKARADEGAAAVLDLTGGGDSDLRMVVYQAFGLMAEIAAALGGGDLAGRVEALEQRPKPLQPRIDRKRLDHFDRRIRVVESRLGAEDEKDLLEASNTRKIAELSIAVNTLGKYLPDVATGDAETVTISRRAAEALLDVAFIGFESMKAHAEALPFPTLKKAMMQQVNRAEEAGSELKRAVDTMDARPTPQEDAPNA